MSNAHDELGEGHSPAAWTAIIIMTVAFTVGTVAFVLDIQWLVWVSAVVTLAGWILGGVLSKMGYGVNGPKFTPKHHQS